MDTIRGIFALLIILSVLVVVHEWGHYIVAKMFKMRVEEFSLFFGKVLVRLGVRHGTEYNIRAVPLGGFVRIAGMEADDISGGRPILQAIREPNYAGAEAMNDVLRQLENDTMAGLDPEKVGATVREVIHSSIGTNGTLTPSGREDLTALRQSPRINEDEQKLIDMVLTADARESDPGLYSKKPIYQRALVILAGPVMSLFFGYFLFCVMGMTIGLPSDKVTNQVIVIPDGAARAAGVQTGDKIVAIDGTPIVDGYEMVDKIHENKGIPLRMMIDRGGKTVFLMVTPRPSPEPLPTYKRGKPILGPDGKPVKAIVGLIGVQPNSILERTGPLDSVKLGTLRTNAYMTQLIKSIFSKQVRESVGGPIAMGQMATVMQRLGIARLIEMAAMFSLSLGVMNLLPIPILDGGHLLLLGVEKARRRKLSPREVYRAQMVGLGLLALIVTFVMYNDIARWASGKAFQ